MTRLDEFKMMLKAIDEADSWDAYPEYFEKLCGWYDIDMTDAEKYGDPQDIYDALVEAVKAESETSGERIRSLRKLTGLSQTKFGELYGIPMRTIQNWENGVTECPEYVLNLLERAVEEDAAGKDCEDVYYLFFGDRTGQELVFAGTLEEASAREDALRRECRRLDPDGVEMDCWVKKGSEIRSEHQAALRFALLTEEEKNDIIEVDGRRYIRKIWEANHPEGGKK